MNGPTPIRILVDSFADESLTNAQMSNAREIVCRLDPDRFHVSIFCREAPDARISARRNTRLITLPQRRQTGRIFKEFLFGTHQLLFYLKPSPASRYYLGFRKVYRDNRITIGTVESQSNLRDEPTIRPEAVKLWEKTVLRCDYLFSNSTAVKRSLKTEYDLDSEVVPTGVDTKFWAPDAERGGNRRLRVLFAGSLRPFKGPGTVLDAAAQFPQADFVLVGDGVMAAELKERVRRENLKNVTFTGVLSSRDLKRQYQESDIFLFPSRWEGSPKVILEAAACGLPVIARRDYQPETILHGKTGYLVASDEELFSRLGEVVGRPELWRGLGGAARKHSESFDWDLITRQWEEIFLNLAQSRSGSPPRSSGLVP